MAMETCAYCGTAIAPGIPACAACGTPVPPPAPPQYAPPAAPPAFSPHAGMPQFAPPGSAPLPFPPPQVSVPQFPPPPSQPVPPSSWAPPTGVPQQHQPGIQWGTPPHQGVGGYQPTKVTTTRSRGSTKTFVVVAAVVVIVGAIVAGIVFIGGKDDSTASRRSPGVTVGSDDSPVTVPLTTPATAPSSPLAKAIAGAWEPCTTSSGTFTFDLPSTPERQHEPFDVMGTSLSAEMMFSGIGPANASASGVLAMEADYGDVASERSINNSFDNMLDGMARGAVLSIHGEVTATRRVSSPIGPAGEFDAVIAGDGLVLHAFTTVHKTTMVIFMVIVDSADGDLAKVALARAVASLRVN